MEYKTNQKRILSEFLQSNSDRAFSIEEIAEEIPVGKSTVYRLMHRLAEDGTVKKFRADSDGCFVYQAVDCGECPRHLHMRCTDCGRLLHMENTASATVLSEILEKFNFSVDSNKTVLFGKCSKCMHN